MKTSTKILNNAIEEFASLPGIGHKTALKFVLHMLKQKESNVTKFTNSIIELKKSLKECKICHNIADSDICDICADSKRDRNTICIVENIRDIISIESTGQYKGLYHVLGGIISPMDGISPSDLNIESLIVRINENTKEIIFALSATIEGDTTAYYIYKKIKKYGIKISSIAKGISVGNNLDYTDELTLGRSIINRIDFENN